MEPSEARTDFLCDETVDAIKDVFATDQCFPTRWEPAETEAEPRPGVLRRFGNWLGRGLGFRQIRPPADR